MLIDARYEKGHDVPNRVRIKLIIISNSKWMSQAFFARLVQINHIWKLLFRFPISIRLRGNSFNEILRVRELPGETMESTRELQDQVIRSHLGSRSSKSCKVKGNYGFANAWIASVSSCQIYLNHPFVAIHASSLLCKVLWYAVLYFISYLDEYNIEHQNKT